MADLVPGWRAIKGVSCSGWDIWLGVNGDMPEGSRFAIWFRRITFEPGPPIYTKGKLHPTLSSGEEAIKEISRAFELAEFDPGVLEDVNAKNPLWASF